MASHFYVTLLPLLLCMYHILLYTMCKGLPCCLQIFFLYLSNIIYAIYFQYIISILCYYVIKWYMFHPQQSKTLQMHQAKQSYTLYISPSFLFLKVNIQSKITQARYLKNERIFLCTACPLHRVMLGK